MTTHDDIIDLESYAKGKLEIPQGKRYQIKVDKEHFVVDVSEMTGRQILELAGKSPVGRFILQMKVGSTVRKIEYDEVVSFFLPGVERFMTIPNEVTEGECATPRRDFILLDGDEQYLELSKFEWEAAIEGGIRRVVIHNWQVPAGYTSSSASVNVQLPPGYPDAQIDMAYFYPPLARADGRTINALAVDRFNGKEWQRWSRHRTEGSSWRMGIDCLQTHMTLVADWLIAELSK